MSNEIVRQSSTVGVTQMEATWRFDVRLISSRVLADYMAHRGETVRSLAQAVKVSPATVGHLRSGKRRSCRPATARAIEEALNAPPGSLFVAEVSRVSRDVDRKAS